MSLGRDLLLYANLQMEAGNDAKALLLLEEAIPLWTTIIAARPPAKESLKASWLAGLADARANARVLLTKASRSREAKQMLLGEIEDCRRLATLLPTQSGTYQLRLGKLEEELAR